jgi:predicted Zn-dependent protease
MLLSEQDAKAISRRLLSRVEAADAEVNIQSRDLSHLRFAANAFTTAGRREDASVSLTVWVGGRKATASTNELEDASLSALAKEAEQAAAVSPADREYVPSPGPQEYPSVGGYVESTAAVSVARRAQAVSDIIGACEKERVLGAGYHDTQASASARATKNGDSGYHRASEVGLSVTARTADGSGSGYFNRDHYDAARLDTARIAREAIGRALRSREPRPLDPGVYTVVLEPQAVADLVGLLRLAFDARSADEGRSAFSAPAGRTRVGEKILDERLSVHSDPWHPEVPGAPFTPAGVPARKMHLVRAGVLETLVYTRFWARQKNKEATPGPVNAIMEGAGTAASLDEMIADTRRGLLVSRFWYLRPTDPRTVSYTGLTRDGLFWIQDGKVAHPVRNLRFNQSILQMLAPGKVDMIGVPERVSRSEGGGFFGAVPLLFPALKVKEFRFTSPSDAV